MKLADIISFDAIVPKLKAADRDGVIAELVNKLHAAGALGRCNAKDIIKAVIKRENEASTGIGKGVAVPHVKHPSIKKVIATVGCSPMGVDFIALDKQPVYSVFLLLSPADNPEKHLQAMEAVFRNLRDDDFRRFLRQAQDAKAVKEIIVEVDEKNI